MKLVRFDSKHFEPASHEDPVNPGVLKKILLKQEEIVPGRVQMVNWALLPVGKSFVPHFHEDMDEVFIMVSGEADLTVDSETISMRKGDCVVVEMQETHTMQNTGETEVEYIVFGVSRNTGGKTVTVPERIA